MYGSNRPGTAVYATFTILFFLVSATGCQKLVEVRSNRGEMELTAFRHIVDSIDKELNNEGLVAGTKTALRLDRAIYLYAPSDQLSAHELREVIISKYESSQQNHPFEIEAVEVVSPNSRGVRVAR